MRFFALRLALRLGGRFASEVSVGMLCFASGSAFAIASTAPGTPISTAVAAPLTLTSAEAVTAFPPFDDFRASLESLLSDANLGTLAAGPPPVDFLPHRWHPAKDMEENMNNRQPT